MTLLPYATVSLSGNSTSATLFNHDFGDIYFSCEQGFAESDHVFIHANHLPERFARLTPGAHFCIGEVGFGSGLNMLNASRHFLTYAPHNTRLFLLSCECSPIILSQLKQLQRHWPLPPWRAALYDQYPHNHAGIHLLPLLPRIDLLLLLGDAKTLLAQCDAQVDAWFLDGFAPSKNPSAWTPELFAEIKRLSHLDTTLSTFSVAKVVRDNLAEHFLVKRTRGFDRKREMLVATCCTPYTPRPNWTMRPPAADTNSPIAIIGGGLAGSATAYALASRGYTVDVYQAPNDPSAASNVPVSVPYLQFDAQNTPIQQYYLAAWHHAQRIAAALQKKYPNVLDTLPITLPINRARDSIRYRNAITLPLLNSDTLEQLADGTLVLHGIGAWQTPKLLSALLDNVAITVYHQFLQPSDAHLQEDGHYLIHNKRYGAIVIATGWRADWLPSAWQNVLRPLRGQSVTLHCAPEFHAPIRCATFSSIPFPTRNYVYVGSTYRPNNTDIAHLPEDDATLLAAFQATYPDYQVQRQSSFIGIRAVTRDYWPLVGALPEPYALQHAYQKLAKDARWPVHQAPTWLPNIFWHAGLGSKGSLTTFINAEIITAMITGTPLPISRTLLPYLLPARTLIRAIIRHQTIS